MNSINPARSAGEGRGSRVTTTFTVDLGFGVVVVRGVPAQVCDLCGADWIEDKTAAKLERIVERAREKHPAVEVANWNDKVRTLAP